MKKALRSLISVCLVMGILVLSLAGCSGAKDEQIKIGVVQLVEHPALDASYQGFVDALADAGYKHGENITIVHGNGQNDQANCQTIATQYLNDKMDLVLAIATTAAQAAANVIKEIPILVTAVTDPEDAKLVASNESPGGNVSGTSDLTPVREQFDLMMKLVPGAQKIAILYTSSETNSVFQANMAKEAASALGLDVVEATVSSSNEIQQVIESVIDSVDAIYIPTDNTFANAMSTVTMVTEPRNVPVIVGEEGMVNNGGLGTIGINYYNLGYQTGEMAVRILKDGAKPADMPIEYLQDTSVTINTDVAEQLGITIPADLAEANTFKK
ncbi:MAG: ABC transporter substrate-binding protein [Clostridiaceae bacterium]|nr:ABC transporter substrate-binding protein [Clostridiaceae bacterium]